MYIFFFSFLCVLPLAEGTLNWDPLLRLLLLCLGYRMQVSFAKCLPTMIVILKGIPYFVSRGLSAVLLWRWSSLFVVLFVYFQFVSFI
ncbi:hypothetical protein BDV36DRAFT_270180 [Aspergillus pseudocaelatus]|uniref:Secreted protein n=1 Tax=Aspergillus pseudocaelatus TaxID=1825620 RepID=A0ABQ6W6X6_9EURO|nr:hypothetical protein BDV36DRAFT_270180 [Aspergillus pseudocaelatus]